MARMKDVWDATWTSVGLSLRTKPTATYEVSINAMVEDQGRPIKLVMDPDRADYLGQALIEYAAKVRKLNAVLEPEKES